MMIKNLVNPANLVLILVIMVSCSCSTTPDPDGRLGSIMFTATHDCDIRLFDSNGRQVAREQWEIGKPPAVVQMKSSGIFVIHADNGEKTIKEPITFVRGNIEHCIEF
jgi:hypothetical protein